VLAAAAARTCIRCPAVEVLFVSFSVLLVTCARALPLQYSVIHLRSRPFTGGLRAIL